MYIPFPDSSEKGPGLPFDPARRRWSKVWLDANTLCRLIDGVWFRFEYADRKPDDIAEVVRYHEDQPERNREHGLRQPGDRRIIRYRDLHPRERRFLARSCQCTRKEIARILSARGSDSRLRVSLDSWKLEWRKTL
jgi:hypothetical protein